MLGGPPVAKAAQELPPEYILEIGDRVIAQ